MSSLPPTPGTVSTKHAFEMCQNKLKLKLKDQVQCVFKGLAEAGNPELLHTELYITDGGRGEVHDVKQTTAAFRRRYRPGITIRHEDIFKLPPGREEPIRTVMTKGEAGIGKTVLTQKFTLDWAEDKTNQNIQFLFPFTFRELNLLSGKKFSLVELVHHFFTEIKEAGICSFEDFQVVFIFDGLDECRLPLDFHKTKILNKPRKSASLDVLLTNLIRGKLLPSAHVWMTTRPAAANQIPPESVDKVTEIRGFSDQQKEEYFRRRFRDENWVSRIISYIKTIHSLYDMCHIPFFCWISAEVLQDALKTREVEGLPKNLTEMFIQFLVAQIKRKNDGGSETDPHWSPESKNMIRSLGRLAFDQLQKGNLIFYESDLTECGIDIRAASVYSGVFTQIFREERGGLYQDKMFSFGHLSVQEFLAALHVHLTFNNSDVNLMKKPTDLGFERSDLVELLCSAVDKAAQSTDGHLDLFPRFVLGLSLPTNYGFLRGFIDETIRRRMVSKTYWMTIQYVNEMIDENLLHCLNELQDLSQVQEIQQSLSSGRFSAVHLSPAQWSALVFILLSSEKELDIFDLKEYSASDEALLRLLPVVKASQRALLSSCNLSWRSCEALSVLGSQFSNLKELELSENDLGDTGIRCLSEGLTSPYCQLETLRLSGCLISEEGCAFLASALSSNPSHLRELDLSYNHPGEEGVELLSSRLKDSKCRLDTLRLEPAGVQYLTPGLRKYSFQLTIDTNTVNREIKLCDNNRKVTHVEQVQSYPDHPDRFDGCPQLLCREALTGRCYWEVEWRGRVDVSVSYGGIQRKGSDGGSWFGRNNQSWSLNCSERGFSVFHNNKKSSCSTSISNRVGVFVDRPAGILSFYKVSSDSLIHLYTFNTTFTEPLYAGFGFWTISSSVHLCSLSSSFTPETETGDSQISYRFRCPGPGVFLCALTRLVFVMTEEAEVLYKTVLWPQSSLQSAGKTPAGLLFNIQCPESALSQLHLPHCETKDAQRLDGSLLVAHITDDDGMSILQPQEITDTHVVVNVPHLSAFGLIWDIVLRFMKIQIPINGQVLLFLRPPVEEHQILDVFLLQENIPLPEVAAQHKDSKSIKISSDCPLSIDQNYSVDCEPEALMIQPEIVKFRTRVGPNFHPTFEIFLTRNPHKVTLMVQDQHREVWKRSFFMTALLQRDIPVMGRVQLEKEDLLNILGDLNKKDFEDFKWYLKNESWNNIQPIKEAKLEDARRHEVVDLLVGHYTIRGAVQVMKSVLLKINNVNLVEELEDLSIS